MYKIEKTATASHKVKRMMRSLALKSLTIHKVLTNLVLKILIMTEGF
ncbi:hypothetical protein PULV_b0578 [Pseudoalteromonas ulvae UL12]|nr:hypothetical protein [Pseudoalteromonas ulvae UL12]